MVASSAHLRATVILAGFTPRSAHALHAGCRSLARFLGNRRRAIMGDTHAADHGSARRGHRARPAASTSSADNEAAARHAKRTACIKQARAKKLVGAQKTAYIKGCIDTP